MLRITPGDSLKMRVGDRSLAFKTAGKAKVQRSKVQLGLVNTDTTTEEQPYAVSADQLTILASATSPVLYRLEGGTDVEGQFAADAVAPRLREWADRMQVQRAVAANLFVQPKTQPPTVTGQKPNNLHPSEEYAGGAGRGSGLAAGLGRSRRRRGGRGGGGQCPERVRGVGQPRSHRSRCRRPAWRRARHRRGRSGGHGGPGHRRGWPDRHRGGGHGRGRGGWTW